MFLPGNKFFKTESLSCNFEYLPVPWNYSNWNVLAVEPGR